jgi:hypothetical protein
MLSTHPATFSPRLAELDQVLIDRFTKGVSVDPAELSALLSNVFGRTVTPSAEHLAPMSN